MNDQSWTTTLTDAVARVAQNIFDYLPAVLASLLLFGIGWVVARALRRLTSHLAARSMQRVARTRALRTRSTESRAYRSAPGVLGGVVFWTVLLFFGAAAIEALGLPAVSNVLGAVAVYLPRILLALVIVLAGFWGGELARSVTSRAASRTGLAYPDVLGRVGQVLVVVLAAIVALDQVGVDSTVLITSLATAFAATLGAGALAFGLGARTAVGNIIAARYVQRAYSIGDSVRIGGLEGRVAEITDTAVLLESPEGRVMVPAQRFAEEISVLMKQGR